MMRFYLDGNLVDPAVNWDEVNSVIRRDQNLNVFLLFQEYDLTFAGSGFTYLVDKIENTNFCNQVEIEIQKNCDNDYRPIFKGILFISDCEVNEKEGTVKVKVSDKSFFSKVNNNKNIKTSLDGGFTKNGDNIIAAEIYDLELFNVVGNTTVRTVQACRVEEAFRYMVDFITDNSIDFVSDTFGANGPWNGLCVCTGERLRGVTVSLTDARWKLLSFLQLFTEINKRIPLILLVEDPYINPKIRIESIDYLYNADTNFIATSINQIVTSFDTSKLYALVKFGSPTDDTITLNFPEDIDFLGYKNEEFHLLGNCNLDQSLDLTGEWIVSSNIMERVISSPTPDQGYDDDIFLINSVYTDDFTGRTTNTDFLNTGYFHYNELLNNKNIASRYNEEISNSIASYYIANNTGKAYGYTNLAIDNFSNFIIPWTFPNILNQESYDYGNYFNIGTGLYTSLVAAEYNVTAQYTLLIGSGAVGTNVGYLQGRLEHYDAASNLINIYEILPLDRYVQGVGYYTLYTPGTYTYNKDLTLTMAQNDYLLMSVFYYDYATVWNPVFPGSPNGGRAFQILNSSSQTYLKVNSSSLTGGVVLNIDPNVLKTKLHKFTYPLSQNDFELILNNPVKKIGFAMENQKIRYGWIKELKYNHTSGKADFTISTSKDTEYAY